MLTELTKMRRRCQQLAQSNVINSKEPSFNYYSNMPYDLQVWNQSSEKVTNIQSSFSDHIITREEDEHIKQALLNHFLISEIGAEVLQSTIQDFFYFSFEQGQVIYEEGDEGQFFFIIAEGTIEVISSGKTRTVYSNWQCFGERSLISNKRREETLRCLSQVGLFCLNRESFKEMQKKVIDSRLRERFNFLNSISLFKALESIPKYNVIERMKLKEFNSNETILKRGDIGHTLYMIITGLVSCRIEGKELRCLAAYDYFGLSAALIDGKRKFDVIAVQPTKCYEISKNNLIEALGDDYINSILFCFFINSINRSAYLKQIFIESKQRELFKLFRMKTYQNNEYIVPKGDSSVKRLIIVIEGTLFQDGQKDCSYAQKGEVIGEELFKNPSNSLSCNIFAHYDCITLEAEFNDLLKTLNINLSIDKPLNLLKRISKLNQLLLFQNLSEATIESIAKRMQKVKYAANTAIVKEDSFGDQFYLISKGRVSISVKGKKLRELEKGSCFGEIALLTTVEKRTATVTAIDQVICYVISKKDFDMILENKAIKDYMMKKLALQNTSIELKDLHYLKFLGKGKFGNVSLVHYKKSIYAIKAVSRLEVNKTRGLSQYFINERKVMLSLDHPFITKMIKTLKNDSFCFFLMEYIDGINLDEYLESKATHRSIQETQFYIGSLLLMVEYLQKKQIAHRDIKPSNIMIAANGYLKMIDFGTAKELTDYTNTIIGTPHYIAPEILIGKGYSLSCDFWSIGICMYEMFYGRYPFGNYAIDEIDIYKDIVNREVYFPSEDIQYAQVNSFIKSLLMKKVHRRVCCVSQLKTKDFFNGFHWDKLTDFKLPPPYLQHKTAKAFDFSQSRPFTEVLQRDPLQIKSKEELIALNEDESKSHWADEF